MDAFASSASSLPVAVSAGGPLLLAVLRGVRLGLGLGLGLGLEVGDSSRSICFSSVVFVLCSFLGLLRAASSVTHSVRLLFWLEPGPPSATPCPRALIGPESVFGFAAGLLNESRDSCRCAACRVTLGGVPSGLFLRGGPNILADPKQSCWYRKSPFGGVASGKQRGMNKRKIFCTPDDGGQGMRKFDLSYVSPSFRLRFSLDI